MSIAGDMILHEEAGTEFRPAKLLLKRKQIFVANRTAQILENSKMDQWRYDKLSKNLPQSVPNERPSKASIFSCG